MIILIEIGFNLLEIQVVCILKIIHSKFSNSFDCWIKIRNSIPCTELNFEIKKKTKEQKIHILCMNFLKKKKISKNIVEVSSAARIPVLVLAIPISI